MASIHAKRTRFLVPGARMHTHTQKTTRMQHLSALRGAFFGLGSSEILSQVHSLMYNSQSAEKRLLKKIIY